MILITAFIIWLKRKVGLNKAMFWTSFAILAFTLGSMFSLIMHEGFWKLSMFTYWMLLLGTFYFLVKSYGQKWKITAKLDRSYNFQAFVTVNMTFMLTVVLLMLWPAQILHDFYGVGGGYIGYVPAFKSIDSIFAWMISVEFIASMWIHFILPIVLLFQLKNTKLKRTIGKGFYFSNIGLMSLYFIVSTSTWAYTGGYGAYIVNSPAIIGHFIWLSFGIIITYYFVIQFFVAKYKR